MIDENKSAFVNLIDQLTSRCDISVKRGRRFIKSNDLDKRWLQEADILESLSIIPNTKAILLDFDSNNYLCLIGMQLENDCLDNVVMIENPLNAGLVTVLIGDGSFRLDKKSNELEFYNEIMSQHEDEDYSGHEYTELLKFLEPINLYILPQDSVLKNQDLKRILTYVYSKNEDQLVLNFNDNVLETVSELSLVGSNNISFSLLLSCMFSTSYRHAFLEVYRLVERLFPISYLKEFHEQTQSTLSFLDFSSSLESITSWRPREEEALQKIFESFATSTEYYFNDFFASSPDLTTHSQFKYFYKLRNSIVHFRSSHEESELTNDQWNKLILATLFLIDEHYSLHHKILL